MTDLQKETLANELIEAVKKEAKKGSPALQAKLDAANMVSVRGIAKCLAEIYGKKSAKAVFELIQAL